MNICLLNDSFAPVLDGVVNVVMNYASLLQTNHSARVIVGTPACPGADYAAYPYPVVPCQSFDTTAVGMMENISDAAEDVERFWEKEAKERRGSDRSGRRERR